MRYIDAEKIKYMGFSLGKFVFNGVAFKEDIDKMPTADVIKPEWISVEDRLPDSTEYVLCWYEYFRYGDYNQMYQTYGIGYYYDDMWGGEVSNGTNAKVLYWMPLPKPPKTERK